MLNRVVSSAAAFFMVAFSLTPALAAPRVLFHAGDRAILNEDIQAHTIPQTAWDQYIFGKTNFDLPEFRKGLYGAERLADVNLYLAYELLSGRRPWVMSIALTPACQTPEAVFSSDYVVYPENSPKNQTARFSNWYWKNKMNLIPGAALCLQEGSDHSYWDDQAQYDLHSLPVAEQKRLSVCNDVMNRFLNDEKIVTVLDHVNENSWYLRDRNCIANIRGQVTENFVRLISNGFGDRRDLTSQNWYGNLGDPGSTYSGHTIFVLTVLSEVQAKLGERELSRLKIVTDDLDQSFDQSSDPLALNLDHNADNPQIVSLAFKSMTRAIRAGQLASWQTELQSRLTTVVDALGRACQGHHGVAAANVQACSNASVAQSRQLTSFLVK